MTVYNNHITGNQIFAFADEVLFSPEAVFKCLYWFGDKFSTDVRLQDGFYHLVLSVRIDSGLKEADLGFYLNKLERDLVDFNLRDIVGKETATIRELLIAKAFSNGEYDELPPGTVSDPVGFNLDAV